MALCILYPLSDRLAYQFSWARLGSPNASLFGVTSIMASHHGEHGHAAHEAAHHAADHAHDAHHGHGSMYKAKQPWMNPLTDPYRGWRFDKFAKRRMWFFGLAWGYGVVFGGWMSYRLFNEYGAWTYPVRSRVFDFLPCLLAIFTAR